MTSVILFTPFLWKSDLISQTSSVLVISLKLFHYDRYTGTTAKIKPYIKISEKINVFDELSLAGIILHEGEQSTSGHYTAVICRGETWYFANDSVVGLVHDTSFIFSSADRAVPYILFYVRSELPTAPLPATMPPMSDVNQAPAHSMPPPPIVLPEPITFQSPPSDTDVASTPVRKNFFPV